MTKREYEKVLLFMGILSVRGFPDALRKRLEEEFGPVDIITEPFPFDYTDYYVQEMGEGIERFFVSFHSLVFPDDLALIKERTNSIEEEWMADGGRSVNLDPGLLSYSSVILATTKNRAHRIAIGRSLYAELTLMYQGGSFVSFPWTYADYRSKKVEKELLRLRDRYKELRKLAENRA